MESHSDAGEPGTPLQVVLQREQLRSRRRLRRRTKLAAANAAVFVLIFLALMLLIWLVYSSPLPSWAKIGLSILVSGGGLSGAVFEVDPDTDSSR